MMDDASYSTPTLTVLGSVDELTEGGTDSGTDLTDGITGSAPETK